MTMEGADASIDVKHWSISQVLSWLKSTNDGQFDLFVPIFRKHEIYGDALLSLSNDILRDELNIVAYGARHALLKAIKNLSDSQRASSRAPLSQSHAMSSNSSHAINRQSLHHLQRHLGSNRHRKASLSSVCSKASARSKTSFTYCFGDVQRDNCDTLHGIDDNWENLSTMAKHGIVDASEYLKQARLIVKAVTGTTIKLTRQASENDADDIKSGFFQFEELVPDWNCISAQTAIKYEWNTHTLEWQQSDITVKIAQNPFSRGSLRVSYYCLELTDADDVVDDEDHTTPHALLLSSTTPKSCASNPVESTSASKNRVRLFHQHNDKHGVRRPMSVDDNDRKHEQDNCKGKPKGKESMSVPASIGLHHHHHMHHECPTLPSPQEQCFSPSSLPEDEKVDGSRSEGRRYTDQIEDNEEKSAAEHSQTCTFPALIATKTNLQKDDLVSRLLGFEHRYGGNLIVAKQSIDLTESVSTYFNDARTQSVAQLFGNEYNKYNPPKKVAFIKASVIQLLESDSEQFFCVEDYLHGAYMKHLDNYGGDEGIRNTPSAFAHFTYEASRHRLLVVDIQGVGDLYTDPQIHTANGVGFGKGNLGIDGMIKFLQTHQCNAICQHLRLEALNPPKPIVFGTRPAKMYMDLQRVKSVEHTEQISTDEYHHIPHIPISTLNDFYRQQIYAMQKQQHKQHHKHSNESHEIDDDRLDRSAENSGNNHRNIDGHCYQSSNEFYNPLTPLITTDHEDTKCVWCGCIIL
mmetsp:Transcript_1124/g.2162  ORF Transcript_1124/g.2162 Transcript_1124/m.2162 type:complete len:748 (-) Transcript_1124:4-2247(-)